MKRLNELKKTVPGICLTLVNLRCALLPPSLIRSLPCFQLKFYPSLIAEWRQLSNVLRLQDYNANKHLITSKFIFAVAKILTQAFVIGTHYRYIFSFNFHKLWEGITLTVKQFQNTRVGVLLSLNSERNSNTRDNMVENWKRHAEWIKPNIIIYDSTSRKDRQ